MDHQSQLFGLYMTMSVEPFDSATALSKEASDENLWKLKSSLREDGLTDFICSSFDIFALIF